VARKKRTPSSRLSVRYIDDQILLSDTHAWTYVRLPLIPYEFLSYPSREGLCDQITLALASLVTSNQESVDVHLRITHRPFDTGIWAKTLDERVRPWAPTPGWANYLTNMGLHVHNSGFDQKEVYLGVCLGERRTAKHGPKGAGFMGEISSTLQSLTNVFENAGGFEDLVVPESELDYWHSKARDVHRTLANSHLKGIPATSKEVAWLIAKPLWPDMIQPPPTASDASAWGPGEVRSLGEGVVTNNRRWVEVEQMGPNGMPQKGYAVTLAVSRFPDVMLFPDNEPWMHYAAAFPFPTEFSTRMSIVPATKVKKDVGRKLADAKDQAQHIAEAGTSIPLQVREQLEVATVLEYQIDKDRMPWAYARHRLTIVGGSPEEVSANAKTLIESYRDLSIDLAWPTGDQFELLLESMPGDKVRTSSYQQRQELAAVAGGMPTASAECGDRRIEGKGWFGPYLGYTTSRVVTPVFLSPHVAMTRNYPPGISIVGSPGGGKALALDTPIATPTGWTTIGEIQIGDQVFAPDGTPTVVVDTSPVFTDHDCYLVTFDDGTSILADAGHRWEIETRQHRVNARKEKTRVRRTRISADALTSLSTALKNTDPNEWWTPETGNRLVEGGPSATVWSSAARDLEKSGFSFVLGSELGSGYYPRGRYYPAGRTPVAVIERGSALLNDQRTDLGRTVKTTAEMADDFRMGDDKGRARYSIPMTAPLSLPYADLPVHPYILGLWLADGTSCRGEITTADPEVLAAFEEHGYPLTPRKTVRPGAAHTYGVGADFGRRLSEIGVLNNKHIPVSYLRASVEQRRALFAGLCDGDGTVAMDGGQEFSVVNDRLARDFAELAATLGIKTSFNKARATMTLPDGSQKDYGFRYRVAFTATIGPALPRKVSRLPSHTRPTTRRRYITDISRVETVPTRCITVAHPSHLFLAGKQMVPTHNSFSAFTLAYQMAMQGVWTIYIDPKADAKPMAQLGGLGSPRIFDLRDGNDGMLDPFSLGENRSESTLLALETLRLLLGGNVSEEREEALLNAVEQISQTESPSLSGVVDILLSNEESAGARNLGAVLRTIRELPFARLCFAPTGGNRFRPEDGLTVVTLLGLDLPSASTRADDYSYENRLAVSVMYLLTRYARGLMLSLDKSHPKAICIDEAWAITSTPQGAKLIPEIARMGRSHNTALVLVSQNAKDLMAESVTNSISTKLAFRSTIPAEIDDVLTLFGLDLDQGYQGAVRDLRNGECLMQDVDGRVSRVRIDDWNRELFEAFNTNPETRGKGAANVQPGQGGGG